MGEIIDAILTLIGSLARVERRNRKRTPVIVGVALLMLAVVLLAGYGIDSLR